MWQLFVAPLLAALVAQLVKVFSYGRPRWTELWSSGGMPSMHASLAAALATVVYLAEGASTAFAVACAVLLLAAIDARRLRREVGQQAAVINRLIEQLPDDREYSYPILGARLGHTGAELLGGVGLGVAVALLLWLA